MPATRWRCGRLPTERAMSPEPHSLAHRALHSLRVSLRWRLVALFLLLALAMTAVFMGGVQRAFSQGWREAARKSS